MKPCTWCACVIAILLLSTAAFSEILTVGDWDGEGDVEGDWDHSSASSRATGENNYDYSWGDGWMYMYTTETAHLNWYTYGYVWAEVKMYLWNYETCVATSIGCAKTRHPYHTDELFAAVDITRSGDGGLRVTEYDGVYDHYDYWHNDFEPYDGVYGGHTAIAIASMPEGGDSTITGHACVQAWVNLFE